MSCLTLVNIFRVEKFNRMLQNFPPKFIKRPLGKSCNFVRNCSKQPFHLLYFINAFRYQPSIQLETPSYHEINLQSSPSMWLFVFAKHFAKFSATIDHVDISQLNYERPCWLFLLLRWHRGKQTDNETYPNVYQSMSNYPAGGLALY